MKKMTPRVAMHAKGGKKKKKQVRTETATQGKSAELDVLALVRNENTGTKPNMAKFLKQYVASVRALTSGALGFYPRFEYRVQRVFVRFVDGHELIFYPGRPKPENRHVCTYRYEDVKLDKDDLAALDVFFQRLFDFRFVFDAPVEKAKAVKPDGIISKDEDRRRDSEVPDVEG